MKVTLTSREREIAFALPALCFASCLPSGDLDAYSAGQLDDSVVSITSEVAGSAGATQPGTGGETPVPLGLASGTLVDAGAGGESSSGADAVSDAAPASPCGAARSLGPNGNCYRVESTLRVWSDARANCRATGNGWDLASLRSARDSVFVAELVTLEAWIGASDGEVEGTWIWVQAGDAFWSGTGTGNALNGAYANWNNDEPNGGEASDCARILPRNEMFPDRSAPWADIECSQQRAALCEGPLG